MGWITEILSYHPRNIICSGPIVRIIHKMKLVEVFFPYLKTVLAHDAIVKYGKNLIFKVTKDKVSSYTPP